jgi:predicted MFS family arabinose efflux permease
MQRLLSGLYDSFTGLSKEVWWLSLITLINRAGTMVIPFLSLYLTKGLGYTLSDVGWVMTSFGLGSVVGSWLGGKLTDRFGAYKIMVFSLMLSGVFFVLLQYLESFWFMCGGVFLVLAAADLFRPAMFVALKAYSKPQNKTRSVTLIRLAINLGFSMGPVAGGFIIATIGYDGLFWIDGITCFLAAVLLLKVLNPKRAVVLDSEEASFPISAYSDKNFWIFFAAMALFGFTFLQYFSTLPLY